MNDDFTPEEIEGIVQAMHQEVPTQTQIPLKPPGSYGPISKVTFGQLAGSLPEARPLGNKEMARFQNLSVTVEVEFGTTHLPLQEVASLAPGSLIPLDQAEGEPVTLLVEGKAMGRGEIVTVDGFYAVRILTLMDS